MASRYLRKQGRRYWARFQVPLDVREAFGKMEVWENLGTDDARLAEARVHRAASDFRARVLEARGRLGTVEADALAWRREIETEPREEGNSPDVAHDGAVRAASDRYVRGGHKAVDRLATLYHQGNAVDALVDLGGSQARTFVDIAILGRKPLRSFVAAWETARASEVEPKTATMDKVAVERFVAAFPLLSDVTKAAVSGWTQSRKGNVAGPTVQREVSGVRSFWQFLGRHGEYAADAPDPFAGLRFNERKKLKAKGKRERFTPREVAALFGAARAKGDNDLADLIHLAAYTGARREELCALKVTEVSGGWLKIKNGEAKTEAGARDVPVHARIKATLARLIGKRKAGYVLPDLDADKYGKRGDAVGKRFSRLKASLGHGKTKTFHSIRHTVTNLLEAAGVAENLTADLVGHQKTTMSYGLYSGRGATRELLPAAIKCLRYPRPLEQ